jgi:hypothetical protein
MDKGQQQQQVQNLLLLPLETMQTYHNQTAMQPRRLDQVQCPSSLQTAAFDSSNNIMMIFQETPPQQQQRQPNQSSQQCMMSKQRYQHNLL